MTRAREAWFAAGLCCLASCTPWHAQPLPAVASRSNAGVGRLLGGLAQVDITPPPGVGMGGSGTEGRRSTGYRTRLYARALVLEDASGERIALVVADLAHVSANLHRLVAARVVGATGIGSDRLILSATHTHSAPAHFYAERQYNLNVSRVPGYDPAMVSLLVNRISTAVLEASAGLAPVVLAAGRTTVSGVTRNRSLEAYCLDPEASQVACDTARPRPDLAIDTTLWMLRVDRARNGSTVPLGSYAILALHPTAIPSLNTLLDGDTHARIVARLTRHTDSVASRAPSDAVGTVNILANGAEGDVTPAVEREGCDLPALGPVDPVPMPRGPGEMVDFVEPEPVRARRCVARALDQLDTLAERVAARAVELYDALGRRLTSEVTVRRAFATAWLPGNDGLCRRPTVGASTAAGAEGLESRVRGWHWLLPFVPLGLDEGPSAVRVRSGVCSSPKLDLVDPLQTRLVVGEHGFPDAGQFTVVRIGSTLLGAVPAEVTTVAGWRMRDAMLRADSAGATEAYLIGLANGFLQYVTTAEEYQWQAYEGGSTLYGPGSAKFFQHRLVELTASLPSQDAPSPPADVLPLTAHPGPPSAILPSPTAGPDSLEVRVDEVDCAGGRLTLRWLDRAPGRLFPRDGPLLLVEQDEGGATRAVATDGDGRLEVRARGDRGKRGYLWEARWTLPASGRLHVSRLDGAGKRIFTSTVTCGA